MTSRSEYKVSNLHDARRADEGERGVPAAERRRRLSSATIADSRTSRASARCAVGGASAGRPAAISAGISGGE